VAFETQLGRAQLALAEIDTFKSPMKRSLRRGRPIQDWLTWFLPPPNLAGEDIEAIRAKWVWLVLSWVYEKHSNESSVFDIIDTLYADFGYPEEMVAFGPFAPACQAKSDPAETREEVLREWRRYLDRGEDRFGRRA
jgi:hypothetical protein